MKKILIVGNLNSPFLINYLEHFNAQNEFIIDVVSLNSLGEYAKSREINQQVYIVKNRRPFLKKVPIISSLSLASDLLNTLKKIPSNYDIVHIQFVHFYLYFLKNTLQLHAKKTILTYWGGDVHFMSKLKYFLLRSLQKQANKISTTSTQYKKRLLLRSPKITKKTYVTRFGLNSLNYLKEVTQNDLDRFKNKYLIPSGKKYVMVGTNALENQQHINVLNSLKKYCLNEFSDIQILLPLTYARNEDYLNRLNSIFESVPFNITKFDSYLSDTEMATLTKLTDILIQVQKVDQLSGVMLEHLYSGSEVITGSWLKYEELDTNGISYTKIHNVEGSGKALKHILSNMGSKAQQNSELVWNLASWEKNISNWIKLYH